MSTTTAPAIGTTARIPIGEFVVDANIRKDVQVPKDFLASVKQDGVLVPVEAYLAPDGRWHLQDGQLRYLAAVDSGKTDIPVIVVDPETAEALRLQRQLILNELRTPITDLDRVTAYQTLFELGVSAEQIARKTKAPVKRVTTALAVAGSASAVEVLQSTEVTLEQAASLVEFEDEPEAVESLTQLATTQPGQFNHRLEQLRTKRAQRLEQEKLEQELAQAGYRIIDKPESTYQGPTITIDCLYTDAALKKRLAQTSSEKLPVETPGLAAYVSTSGRYEGNNYVYTPHAVFVVEDWAKNGFYSDDWRSGRSSSSAKKDGGGLSDEERAKRRVVRDNNKLWQPATAVRRAWLKEFLQRKELPKDAISFVARYFGPLPNWTQSQSSILRELLSIDDARSAGIPKYLEANPTQSLNVLLAGALAAAEGVYDFGKDGWRRSEAKAHLAQLSAWGYTLSPIEEAVVKGTAEQGVSS